MNTTPQKTPPRSLSPWARIVTILGVALGVLALLLMLLSGPAYRMQILGLGQAFSMLGLGAKIGIAAGLVSLLALVLSILVRKRSFGLWAILGILLGVAAILPPWMFMHKARAVPPIHDISTDTVNPPAFKAVLALRADSPNSPVYGGAKVAAQQHKAYPDIKPLQFKATPDKVFAAALKTARGMGWKIAASDASSGHIEATSTTTWFGFKDDVVIRIHPDADGTRLDIRSESRVGKSDVGKNAERIRAFSKRLNATQSKEKMHP
jgi:uncharacterized protein (DUF1499 family)